jgi:hypothetical protein
MNHNGLQDVVARAAEMGYTPSSAHSSQVQLSHDRDSSRDKVS